MVVSMQATPGGVTRGYVKICPHYSPDWYNRSNIGAKASEGQCSHPVRHNTVTI